MSTHELTPIVHMPYALAAYKKACAPEAQARRIFSIVFERAIEALTRLKDLRRQEPIAFVSAINDNLMLWEHLMADVRSPKSPLPNEVRAQIMSLGGFVRAQSKRIKEDEGAVEPLIDINRNILAGLEKANKAVEEMGSEAAAATTVEQLL